MNLIKGKKGLIMGVANERSIAWGISQKLASEGADLAFTYLGDALKKRVVPLAKSLNSDFTSSKSFTISSFFSTSQLNVTFELSFSASGTTLFFKASPKYVKANSAPASASF